MLSGIFSFFSTALFAGWFSKSPDLKLFFKDKIQLELAQSIVDNNLVKVEKILSTQKPDEILNRPGYLWATPMHFAFTWSQPEMITYLIQKGGDPFQLAYHHGYPVGAMLTSKLSNKIKIEKLKSIQKAGVSLTDRRFTTILNHTWVEIHPADFPNLRNDLIDFLLAEYPQIYKELMEDGDWFFNEALRESRQTESISFLIKLLEAGMDPMAGNNLAMPLAALLLKNSEKATDSEKKIIFDALAKKGLSQDYLIQTFGKTLTWRTYFPRRTEFDPGHIYVGISTSSNSSQESPKLELGVLIENKAIKDVDLTAKRLLAEFVLNLEAKNFTWHKSNFKIETDLKYLNSIKETAAQKEKSWRIEVDLMKAFPEWKNLPLDHSIIELRSHFLNSLNQKRVFQQIETTYVSRSGAVMPVVGP